MADVLMQDLPAGPRLASAHGTAVILSISLAEPGYMNRLTLNQKLWSVLALLWLGIVVLVIASTWMHRSDLLEQRKRTLSQQVDTAMGIISHFQKKTNDKTLSVADAKAQGLKGPARKAAVDDCFAKARPDLAAAQKCRKEGKDKSHADKELKAYVKQCVAAAQ